jgi:predicted enzyme related to lactoylglutathione lyase
MSDQQQPQPAYGVGSFCWNELYTPDLKKAKTFYEKVLNWKFVAHGDMGDYNMIMVGKEAIGGAMDTSKPEFGGMPSCWGYYVDVENCDKTVERAKKLGATLLNGPMEVPEVGRFAALKDPTGAAISVITLRSHGTKPECADPGHFLWRELMTRDVKKATAFYTELLNWKTQVMPMPEGDYTLVQNKHGNAGGIMKMPPDVPKEVPNNWVGYIHVTDVDKTAKAVDAAGGHTFFPPMDIPNVGRFTHISDPTGAVVAIMTPQMPA